MQRMDGTVPETCGECGFNGRAWRVRDAVTLLDALGMWWRLATDDLAPADLNRRPWPTTWSALEYGLHSALVTGVLRAGIEQILAVDGVALPPLPRAAEATAGDVALSLDPARVVADLEREGHDLARLARLAPEEQWEHVGHTPDGESQRAGPLLRHSVHDATHHQMDVARGFASLRVGTPRHEGRVTSLNVSDGGVPKRPIGAGEITYAGLTGDRNADSLHHGRPFQALCLWSADVINDLAADGHPIGAGCAGENLTLAGVDWAALRPGTRVRIGSALAELSFPAVPCPKQTGWFNDGDFKRISYERNPQFVRWYAWVREPGSVHPGDAVLVQG